MNTSKPFYTSKTLWFNVLMIAVLIAEQVPAIWPNSPEWFAPAALTVVAVGNILIRVIFTEQPLSLKGD